MTQANRVIHIGNRKTLRTKCGRHTHLGQQIHRISVVDGITYRPCDKCGRGQAGVTP